MPGAPARVWVAVVAGLAAIGISPILIRYAGDAPALTLAAWRTGAVTLAAAPLALRAPERAELAAFTARDWGLVGCAGVFLGGHFMTWIVSVQLTSVASASVLVTMSPIFIAVLGALVLKERPSRRLVAAIGVAVVGAAFIGLSEDASGTYPNPALGNALALGAALLVSVYLLIGRAVRQRTSLWTYFFPLNAVACATCLACCLAAGVPLALSPPVAVLAVAMGLGPGLVGHGSFTYALAYLPAALIGLLSLGEPIIASVAALVLFGETPAALAVVGMAVVLAAIAAVVTSREG